jgi:subfamily B ATP-binding cassette protein MsbA
VSYTYPKQYQPALKGVNLQVRHGQIVAIIGGNGVGKSTLVNLLPRLIEPDNGRILMDGIDIAKLDLNGLRSQMAVVPQEVMLVQDTIARNIAYGLPAANMKAIEKAAEAAFAHDFITQFPNGYQTELGEMGAGLSVGEKQRLAIARAILRDPAVLILDEATSQIDPDSESKINQVIRNLRGAKTVFVITHRLSGVLDADLIVVMAEGTIADAGSHSELLQRCSLYQAFAEAQLQATENDASRKRR